MPIKFIPKYPTTWNEYDSNDILHIINSIEKYKHKEETKRIIIYSIPVILIIVFFVLRSVL